jgi:tetratricopeptide (TPR) repeat protein
MFAMAGQCAVNLKEFQEAEDLANRSLLLVFSEQALTIRMFSRSQTAQLEDALADCDELLQLNPKHEFAKSMQSRLKSALEGE